MIRLVPLFEEGSPITFHKNISKFTIGKAEIKKSLKLRHIRKVSNDHFELFPDHENEEVKIKAVGKNCGFFAPFEYPIVRLKPGESTTIKEGDILAFRKDLYVYRVHFSNLPQIPQKPEIKTQETLNFDSPEKEIWTSGSESDQGESKVTPDDSNKRVPCEFGQSCYRQNPIHKKERSHPGDSDWSNPTDQKTTQANKSKDRKTNKPECEFGLLCYQKNPAHRRQFTHSKVLSTRRKRRAALKAGENIAPESDDSNFSLSESENEWSAGQAENSMEIDDEVDFGEENDLEISESTKALIKDSKQILRDNNFKR